MTSRSLIRHFGVLAAVACLPVLAGAQTTGVSWRTNLDAAKIEAAQTNRLLLLHFWSQSCGPCKVLDQNVFSQPHVGAAIEQDYVPVKVDADASPALASAFRIDRVPTEIVLTPEGNVIATLPIPDKPEAYVAQLQNLVRHHRQTTSMRPAGMAQHAVNPAYAGLDVGPPPSHQGTGMANSATSSPASAANPAIPAQPQVQSNPYVGAAAAPPSYGEAQSVYAAQPTTPPARYAQATPAASSPTPPPAADAASPDAIAASTPMMPSNAMPRSYRNPLVDPVAVATAPAVTPPPSASTMGIPAIAATTAPTTSQAPPAAAPSNDVAASTPPTTTAAAVAAAPTQPRKIQLPAGCPPVAFDGCCPVTLRTVKKWAIGDPQFGAIHRGRTYLFAGAQQREQFLANPDAFSPVFAGLDPVLLIDKQQSVPGTRQFGFEYGGAFYLFSGKESMDRFAASPQTYAAGVRQAMSRIDAMDGDVIRR